MPIPATQTDESECPRLPTSSAPKAAATMSHDRTAEAGAPQKATKSRLTPSSTADLARGPMGSVPRKDERTVATMAMCPPETATRWDTPQREKSSSVPSRSMGVL